jgi:hypothetical protein
MWRIAFGRGISYFLESGITGQQLRADHRPITCLRFGSFGDP